MVEPSSGKKKRYELLNTHGTEYIGRVLTVNDEISFTSSLKSNNPQYLELIQMLCQRGPVSTISAFIAPLFLTRVPSLLSLGCALHQSVT